MRLRTIWTLKGLPFMERLRRTRDWVAMAIAAALPVRIRYWVTMQQIGHATRNSPDVPETKLDWILDNLERPKTVT